MSMRNDMESILFSEDQIQEKILEVSAVVAEEYKDKNPLIVGVLKGSVPFMSDFIRRMDILMEYDFMAVSSYGNGYQSTGEVNIIKDLSTPVEGRDILILEDIIDTGLTLSYLVDLLKARKANSVKIVTLLDKPTGRKVDIQPDFRCFEVGDVFVVGYGLDFHNQYRNTPYIGIMKESMYKK